MLLPNVRALTLSLLLMLSCTWAASQGLRAEPLQEPVEALPRQTITLPLRLQNENGTARSVQPHLNLPSGWRLLVPPEPVTIPPDQPQTVLFTILVAPDATAGDHLLPVHLEGEVIASFQVRVAHVSRLEVTLLEAPSLTLAEPYTLRFMVRNAGNSAHMLRFSASDNLRMPVSLTPERAQLEPGGGLEVLVTVQVPTSLDQSRTQRVSLTAQDERDGTLRASAQASVELVPQQLSEASAFHTFPLRFRSSIQVDGGIRPSFELSGIGQLWDEDPGRFSLALTPDKVFAAYRHPNYHVALGNQRFQLSPLTEAGRDAFGFDIAVTATPFRLRALAYQGNNAGFGLQGTVSGESVEASVNFLVQPELSSGLISGEVRYRPVLPTGQNFELELEYGLQVGAAAQAHALRLDGNARMDPLSLSASWQGLQAGYRGAARDTTALKADASLRLSSDPLLTLSARWHEQRSYTPSEEQGYTLNAGATLSGRIGNTSGSLAYDYAVDAAREQTKHDLVFAIRLPLSQGISLQQSLGWQSLLRDDHLSNSLSYEASSLIASLGGSFNPAVKLRLGLDERAPHRLDLSLGWTGRVADNLNLHLAGELHVFGNERLRLLGKGSYSWQDGQVLGAEVEGRFYQDRQPALRLNVGYTIPLDVPLGRLSTVGSVSGVIRDGSGSGLAGLVVQVGGSTTVTQEDGSFRFPAVPEGLHYLSIRPDNLMPNQLTLPATPHPVEVVAGDEVQLELAVLQAAQLTGQLLHHPAEGADAESAILGRGRPEEEARLVEGILIELRSGDIMLRSVSDKQGRFSFSHLPPGEWQLQVLSALPDFYRLESAEQSLSLTEGEQAHITLNILPVPRRVHIIEGGVVGGEDDD